MEEVKDEGELMMRAAWLSFVGGYTQDVIAERLGVSRVKVSRLISQARKENVVHVFIDGHSSNLVRMEDRIKKAYGLASCVVGPSLGDKEAIKSVGNAGAKFLYGHLSRQTSGTTGFGNGRTIAAVVEALPKIAKSGSRFVSLSGSLTRTASANPFDMIYKICEKTGGEGYFMPAPIFCDTVRDKEVFMQQSTLKKVLGIGKRADLLVFGLGTVMPDSFMATSELVTKEELAELQANHAVAEVLGNFIDKDGKLVDIDINRRIIGLGLADLAGKNNHIVAAGAEKAVALHAVLLSGLLKGIVVEEGLAKSLIEKFNI